MKKFSSPVTAIYKPKFIGSVAVDSGVISVIDMIRVVFIRLKNKKSPFIADRNHIHHLLLKRFSSIKTLAILNLLIIFPIILILIHFSKFLIISIYIFLYLVLVIYLEKKLIKNGN